MDETVIVTTYPYATVLTFSHCQNVVLENLSIGRLSGFASSSGDTSFLGGSLDFDTCTNVALENVVLGCASCAVSARSAEGVFTFRDCTVEGAAESESNLNITNSKAAFCFDSCTLGGNINKDVFSNNFPTAEMVFTNCTMRNTAGTNFQNWLDRDNVLYENCVFSDGQTRSTDHAARTSRLDPSVYWTAMFTADDLAGTKWHGVLIQYTDTAASSALPYTDPDSGFVYEANVEFNADGTGVFEWYNAPEAGPFLWKMVSVKEASFPGVTVEMFELPDGSASSRVLRLWIENIMIWMEPAE